MASPFLCPLPHHAAPIPQEYIRYLPAPACVSKTISHIAGCELWMSAWSANELTQLSPSRFLLQMQQNIWVILCWSGNASVVMELCAWETRCSISAAPAHRTCDCKARALASCSFVLISDHPWDTKTPALSHCSTCGLALSHEEGEQCLALDDQDP